MTRKSIDLPDLPAPDVVETLDFESLRTAILDDLNSRLDDQVIDLESEPLVKLIEAFAYRELLVRQRVNESARAVMLASAQGADLDNLAALLNVERQAGESDERFRKRVQLAHESYTAAGTAGAYEWHAMDASQAVVDVSVSRRQPGRVDVVVLGPDGRLATDDLRQVQQRIESDEVKPLTDMVAVRNAKVRAYSLEADLTLYLDPDGETVRQRAMDGVRAYADSIHRLGFDATTSGLIDALHVEGVQSAELTQPAENVVVDDDTVTELTDVTVRIAGRAQ